MKVGDYVRTIYGIKRITDIICGQDIRFDNTDGFDDDLLNYHNYDGISINSHTWEEIVIGEPKEKIIELIEVGDYINGYLVKDIDYAFDDVVMNNKNARIVPYIDCNKNNYIDDIKSIVTKEQFESMKYKVGE